MISILVNLISFAAADWGPLPFEEEVGLAPVVENHPSCNFYSLDHGKKLPKDPGIYTIRRKDRSWGTPRMIDTLIRASEEVAWLAQDADPVAIGDLSKRGGGALPPHKSHRGGSDADVGIFYKKGQKGKQSLGFKTVTHKDFDHETNWIFVQALLGTGNVERILLDQELVDELRDYVIKQGEMTKDEAYRVFLTKTSPSAWTRHGVIHHVKGHKNHYHIRTFCEKKIN